MELNTVIAELIIWFELELAEPGIDIEVLIVGEQYLEIDTVNRAS